MNRVLFGIASSFILTALLAAESCSSSNAVTGLAAGCSINSDCNGALICAFGLCHVACVTSKDCTGGATCLPPGVCELPQETTCSSSLPCVTGLVCASDTCKAPCTPGVSTGSPGGCLADQTCTTVAGASQPVCLDDGDGGATDGSSGSSGGSGGSSGGGSGGGSGGSSGGDAGPCANPQTTFAVTGQGDTNPHFNSAVGARSKNALFLLSGYVGPDPNGDGGGPNMGAMFAQAFDPSTGASLGPATPIVPASTNLVSFVFSAAIAPTGQIAVLFAGNLGPQSGLLAAFLTPSSDAGVALGGGAGLQVEREVVVTTSVADDGYETPPQVIWSNASNSFLLSYGTTASGNYGIAIAEYSADGAPTLAGTFVPTDSSGGSQNIRPSAAVSGNLVGVPFLSTLSSTMGYPGLTALDLAGTKVGSSVYLASTQVIPVLPIAVAGTPQGFVAAFSEPSSTVVTFIPTSSSGIVSDGGAFSTMTVPGGATGGGGLLAVADDVGAGGANGVGVVLDYDTGLSFAYVSADGSKVSGPVPVLPHNGSNVFSITNYNGSTVLALGGPNNFSAQIAASGCP